MTQRLAPSTKFFLIDAARTTLDPLIPALSVDKTVTLTDPGDWDGLFAEEIATTRLFKGSFPFGIHRQTTGTPAYIAVIHSPLKVALALYEQQLARGQFTGSFDDFLQSAPQRRLDNLQTRLLSNRDDIWLAPQLEEAKRVLERDITFVCTPDNNADIPFLFAYSFHLPSFDVGSLSRTAARSAESESDAEAKAEAATPIRRASSVSIDSLSLSTLALVDSVFALDRQLHKAAYEIFTRRLDAARRDLLLRHSGELAPPVSPSPTERGSGGEVAFGGVGGEGHADLDSLFETYSARLMQTFTPSTTPLSENAPVFLGYLDSPSPGATIGGTFDVEGWLITTAPEPAQIQVYIDQQPVSGFVQRQPRPDVIAAQRHLRHTTMHPGFTLPIDTTRFADGYHTLTCIVWNSADAHILASHEVIIRNA